MTVSASLRFGIFPTPDASRLHETLRLARVADELGLDLIGVQDHPYQRRFLDTFSLLAVILARTERIGVFPDVANLPLRGAQIIAKSAASLDVMFPGRFRLGLGAGVATGKPWQAWEGRDVLRAKQWMPSRRRLA